MNRQSSRRQTRAPKDQEPVAQTESSEPTPEQKLDQAVTELGGFSKFQIFAFLAVSAGLNSNGFWFYQQAYLMQEPKYACDLARGVDLSQHDAICTSENICAKDSRITGHHINWDHEASLHNWHLDYDLMCMPKAQQGFASSMFWFGWCLTLLWMPRLGDVYGRKKLILYDNDPLPFRGKKVLPAVDNFAKVPSEG